MEKRLAKLFHGGYLNCPSTKQWHTRPIPEPVYWLDWKRILVISERTGCSIEYNDFGNENMLRKLKKEASR
ncbi:MAG: hypothetical protein C0410_02535 [Anaerolinea sp.]|nr:hypothetical protein [Anaerolinea sp.]